MFGELINNNNNNNNNDLNQQRQFQKALMVFKS